MIWVQSSASSVQLVGSWNDWTEPGVTVPAAEVKGWFGIRLQLTPGEHGYLIVEDGTSRLDDRNPLTTFRGEDEVSLLMVADCRTPELRIDQVTAADDGQASAEATFLAAPGAAALDPSSISAQLDSGEPVALESADPATGAVRFKTSGLSRGRHVLTAIASDAQGLRSEPSRVIAWVKPAAKTWDQGLLYQIMIDRFRGDGGASLAPPKTPGSRAGGTLDGVRAEIERGYFDQLGVSGLWLSPVYANPDDTRQGSDGHMYESYHGYWPVDSRGVEPRIGAEAALDALVSSAHAHGIRVLLDLVPNHVYETNPRWLDHQNDGWFHSGAERCVCGAAGCEWATAIEWCWFTPYLPDYRFQNPDAMRLAVDDTIWWDERFRTDGVRIDAVPMMKRATTRRIALGLRTHWSVRDDQFLLGEVFTGPGEGGIDAIRYYMGPDGLDSAFDFPLMWSLRDVVASNKAGFDQLDAILRSTEQNLQGSGAVIARIVGNHDTTRFISVANGDADRDPWASPPAQPTDHLAYLRQSMALTLMMTLPGMPVLYYGDETGLAGGSDPDCRRVMPAIDGLSSDRKAVLDRVRRLGRLRACSKALRDGSRVAILAEADRYLYVRNAADGLPVIVMASKASEATDFEMPLNTVPAGVYTDVLTGESIPIGVQGAGSTVHVEPWTARVLVDSGSGCAKP